MDFVLAVKLGIIEVLLKLLFLGQLESHILLGMLLGVHGLEDLCTQDLWAPGLCAGRYLACDLRSSFADFQSYYSFIPTELLSLTLLLSKNPELGWGFLFQQNHWEQVRAELSGSCLFLNFIAWHYFCPMTNWSYFIDFVHFSNYLWWEGNSRSS